MALVKLTTFCSEIPEVLTVCLCSPLRRNRMEPHFLGRGTLVPRNAGGVPSCWWTRKPVPHTPLGQGLQHPRARREVGGCGLSGCEG